MNGDERPVVSAACCLAASADEEPGLIVGVVAQSFLEDIKTLCLGRFGGTYRRRPTFVAYGDPLAASAVEPTGMRIAEGTMDERSRAH